MQQQEIEITDSQEFKSKLFIVNEFLDPVDDLDRNWRVSFQKIENIIINVSENDSMTKLQTYINEKMENYLDATSGLLYAYLTLETSPISVSRLFEFILLVLEVYHIDYKGFIVDMRSIPFETGRKVC